MSRHEFSTPDPIVVVGWDGPLNTFFAMVLSQDSEDDFDDPPIWLGTRANEFDDARQLLEILRQSFK